MFLIHSQNDSFGHGITVMRTNRGLVHIWAIHPCNARSIRQRAQERVSISQFYPSRNWQRRRWSCRFKEAGIEMNNKLENYIKGVKHLPAAPTVLVRLIELFQQPEHEIDEVAELIHQDPALTAEILRH